MEILSNPAVQQVFAQYPPEVRSKMEALRALVLEAAEETEAITKLEETLRWGEPSYITKQGSTLRMDWKPKLPRHYSLYFQCTSKLVPTFREVFQDLFEYEGTREIRFAMEDELPIEAVKQCIGATLMYHKVKHLDWLGLA